MDKLFIEVEAKDGGTEGSPNPPLATKVTFVLTVTDRNDNAPVFSPPLAASITIPENASVGDVVETLTATDADSNANIQFAVDNDVFKIVQAPGGRSSTTG